MMLAGLAFATGYMTCFGAALVISMVVYVGLSGSALFGALILFFFSIGMGIPLLVGALLMTKVLPLLGRMEKWVHRLGSASSLLMAGLAVLLISGNYMVFTEWVYGPSVFRNCPRANLRCSDANRDGLETRPYVFLDRRRRVSSP